MKYHSANIHPKAPIEADVLVTKKAEAATPSKLVIRNIGIVLSGALENPILEADTIGAENGRISAIGRVKDVDTEGATTVVDARGTLEARPGTGHRAAREHGVALQTGQLLDHRHPCARVVRGDRAGEPRAPGADDENVDLGVGVTGVDDAAMRGGGRDPGAGQRSGRGACHGRVGTRTALQRVAAFSP